ncbi:MAG: energy-coupling factor transporter transmembrane protein EcfT [Candidatus Eiseniibacteriota bacterium]|nr:MAG: energy-coupling factor transporter transmembrane protein EcfT [Candidatus Eisenbacteria bacterium]
MLPRSLIGRYIETSSFVHSIDARVKGVCLLVLLAACLSIGSALSLCLVAIIFALAVLASRLRPLVAVGSVKMLLLFLGMATFLNFLFWRPDVTGGWFVWPEPQLAGLVRGAWVGARLVLMVSFMNLFLVSTPSDEFAEGAVFFLAPFRRFARGLSGVPLVVMIALRFVPLVLAEGNRILLAQRSRGMLTEPRLAARARELRPLVVPLFRSVLRRAEELSVALEVRCFDPFQVRKGAFARNIGAREVVAPLCSGCVFGLVRVIG